ncbi:hypothetical protein KAR91_04720 [Candidatus Pacearchaeota archaeon]|nr:hypothetical protein [Candidatus Pacearchaeota archaeon]
MPELRPELEWFAEQMEKKLKENDDKRGWAGEKLSWMHSLLEREVKEVKAAFKDLGDASWSGDEEHINDALEEVVEEAADVANFAMMIADLANKRKGDKEKS